MGLYTGVMGWPRPDQAYWAIRVIVALGDDVPRRLLLKSFLFGKCQEVQDSSPRSFSLTPACPLSD
jgi:hypothetical protein